MAFAQSPKFAMRRLGGWIGCLAVKNFNEEFLMGKEVEKIENKFAMILYIAVSILFGGLFGCWLRILDVMAGRTLYTLVVFCAIAVVGVAVGAVASIIRKEMQSGGLFFCTVLLAAAGYHVFLMSAVNGLGGSWQQMLQVTTRDFALYTKVLLKSSAIFVLFFGVLSGAAGMTAFKSGKLAFSFSWSIPGVVGFLAGCWLFGAFVTAMVDMSLALRLLPGLLGVTAAAVLLAGGWGRKIGAVAVIVITAGAYFYILPLNVKKVLSKGTFGRLVYRDSGFAIGNPESEQSTLRHTVSVYSDRDYGFVYEMDNRPVMFGNRFHTARTLNAYVPLLMKPKSQRVLLAGAEAGLFAPFFLRAGVGTVEFCGAEKGVIKAAVEQDALLCGVGESGFERLQQGGFSEKYDLIYLTPEPVYMRGSARFFSRRIFKKAADALNENGAVSLHLDARALTKEGFASILGEMRDVFPYMQLWCTGLYDWVLVGAKGPLAVEAEQSLKLLEREGVFKDFVRAGKLSIADALACMVCDERGIDKWLAKSEGGLSVFQISWNAPKAVFDGAKDLISPSMVEEARQFTIEKWFLKSHMDNGVYEALSGRVAKNISARLSTVMAIANMSYEKPEAGMRFAREAAALNPHDALLLQLSERLELDGRRLIKVGGYEGAISCYEIMLSFSKDSPQANYGMGLCLRATDDKQNAYIHFARAVIGAPNQPHYRLEFADAAIATGQFAVADKQYQTVLERETKSERDVLEKAQTMLLYAKALVHKGRKDRDPQKAVELAERACEITGWKVSEAVYGLADIYIETGRVMEGMGLKRLLKEGGDVRTILKR